MGRAERRTKHHGHLDNNVEFKTEHRWLTEMHFPGNGCETRTHWHQRTHTVFMVFNSNGSPSHSLPYQLHVVGGREPVLRWEPWGRDENIGEILRKIKKREKKGRAQAVKWDGCGEGGTKIVNTGLWRKAKVLRDGILRECLGCIWTYDRAITVVKMN